MTTRDLIKQRMSEHTAAGNFICAQSLLGAGGVANTVSLDDKKGLIDLPISDSSNPGVCVGMALGGKRPVYIIRYAGFGWLNYWSIVNYAAKSKEIWGIPCPVFVRCISNEGSIGPVASNMNHSIVAHMPGIKVFAPVTPKEWDFVWNEFNQGDEPILCSEHRKSYDVDREFTDIIWPDPDFTVIAVGGARLEVESLVAFDGKINIHHVYALNPLYLDQDIFTTAKSGKILIVDSDYTTCGISEHIAYRLMKFGLESRVMGLDNRSAGFAPHTDNITPTTKQIYNRIKAIGLFK